MSALSATVSALAATTGNITLSGEQTVDGKALHDGDTCLAWQQTDATQNALYGVRTSTWVRLSQPRCVSVQLGDTYTAAIFILTTTDTYTLATGGAKLVPFTNWIVCSQAAPTTVQPLNPSTLSAFSNNTGNYTSTTLGKKSVLKLAPLSLRSSTHAPIMLAGFSPGGTATYAGGVFADRGLQVWTKITAITADFDITTLTWNGLAALTTGQILYQDNRSGYFAAGSTMPLGTSNVTSDSTAGLNIGASNDTLTYGLLLETKPVDLAGSGFASAITATVTLSSLRGMLLNTTTL